MYQRPVLYSFRRCPYAMRARLALHASEIEVELREILLREKPQEMLEASPKGTVPVLVFDNGQVLEESLDIIRWSLKQNDKEGWLNFSEQSLKQADELIAESDGPFKAALDAYKYGARALDTDTSEARDTGADFIVKLNKKLDGNDWLFGEKFSVADGAILPFIRQFAHVDRDWFWRQNWHNAIRWLEAFLASERFASIMKKYPQWQTGEDGVVFGRS